MKSVFASAVAFGAMVLIACSSTDTAAPLDPDAPVTSCDSSACATGNTCQLLDGDLKCRKSCASNIDPATSCPTNYTCIGANEPTELPASGGCTKAATTADSDAICAGLSTTSGTRLVGYTCTGQPPVHGCTAAAGAGQFCCNDEPAATLTAPLCQKNFNPVVTPNPATQWGVSCLPAGGVYANTACDSNQGFYCLADGPSDGAAYCTRYNCTSDRECAAGFACERKNLYPDAFHPATTNESAHQTQTVCVRRAYGTFCRSDVDCGPIADLPAHCAADANGRGFCTPECVNATNCEYEAQCLDPGIGKKICYPRSTEIVGKGELCSPCQSDFDCGDDGLCAKGEYTPEKACAKKSAVTCTSTVSKCPASEKAGAMIGCEQAADPSHPQPFDNYCVGLYSFGPSGETIQDIGCYTPNR